jgi:hypothetical protein
LLGNSSFDLARSPATLHTEFTLVAKQVSRVVSLSLHDRSGAARKEVAIKEAVIAGWTGRDGAAVEKHIKELEALGVKRPATTPIFYRVAAARITTEELIEVVGESSGGEAEFVLLQHGGRLWVGAGSDHTDREVEKYGVTVSKQICEKPIAPVLWAYEDVAPHWDRLVLRSHVTEGGARALYQEGTVTAMMDPQALIARHVASGRLPEGTLMFGGTLSARGGVRPNSEFAYELDDPVLGRKIAHGYRVCTLPNLG